MIRTIDLARAAGAHHNTVRLYETLGFLSRAERGANGYRRWKADDVDQMVFARRALHGPWPGRRIRESALSLVRLAATGDLDAAVEKAAAHAALVREEHERAERAAGYLGRWAKGEADDFPAEGQLSPREAAAEVGATVDQVRNWERNRLIDTPRDGRTGKRLYGRREIGRLRVIRTLLLAGYSVMAVLRMATALDRGVRTGLREVLDTPAQDEDVFTAFDVWLSSLREQEARASELIALIEARREKRRALVFSSKSS